MTQTSVYVGNDPAELSAYTRWMGRAPDDVLFYLNNDSWSAFRSSIGWAVNLWKPSNVPVIWSVPLTVWGTSLEQVATGAYNGNFLQAAQALAQSKPSIDGNIYVRVGWEFNGTWMPWSAPGHEGAFIQSFQNLVNTFRSVSGQFKFVWDVNAGGSYDPIKAYPGDRYVDVVGMDLYYTTAWDSPDPMVAFRNKVSQSYGLQWQQDFATAHGKATAISEWGVSTNTSGPYIQAMTKWMTDHHMVYENYWDTNAANYPGEIDNGQYPVAAGIYRSAIGALQGTVAASTVTVDTTAPTVAASLAIVDPSHPTAALITVTASDAGSGVRGVEIYDNGRDIGPAVASSAGVWTLTASGIANGGHSFTAVATDGVGNASAPVLAGDVVSVSPPGLSTVFRFHAPATGDHFYTTSVAERDNIRAHLPNFNYEGAQWSTPDKGPGTIDVFRFYNSATDTHFFTTSADERDHIMATLLSYHYEGVAFEAYADAGTPGGLTLERFYNTQTGIHHFSASAGETSDLVRGFAGANWVDEGPGFNVHAPVDGLLHL